MTDIDTAAIRAEWLASNVRPKVIWDLCDALDAARAELEDLRRDTHSMSGAGNMDHWCARAEAAEARIAAVLDFMDCDGRYATETAKVLRAELSNIGRALTGDTT